MSEYCSLAALPLLFVASLLLLFLAALPLSS